MRRACLPALLLALAACSRPTSPAEVYRKFALAARTGDADAVWSMLSGASQQLLDGRAREAAARAPEGVVPASGARLVLGDLSARAPRVKSAVVLRESASAAVVRVEDEAGGMGEVSLVKEGGAWRVVVPGA
jgi:hypothetical protein